jgi:glycosyltransferase involved in cell wall biosynthesis
MTRVLIIEAQMKQYRRRFYELLQAELAQFRIELRVAYSDPPPSESQKRDNCELPLGYGVKVPGYWVAGERLLFQALFREVLAADLVVIDQANKIVCNHVLLLLCRLGLKSVALWGLGENLQADRSEISEWYKRKTATWVDWWFAYTAGTLRYVKSSGFPASRSTAVQNAIDTRKIRKTVAELTAVERSRIRAELGIPSQAPVGIYVGMLHRVKDVPFLFSVAREVRRRTPDFHLLVVGGGPESAALQAEARAEEWIHFAGPRFGMEKARLLGISDLGLMPGRVGLGILDAFAAGLPAVVTELPIHGPEIEYLQNDANGVLTPHDCSAMSAAVSRLLARPEEMDRLKTGALASGEEFSVEAMAANFREGILAWLEWLSKRRQLPQLVSPHREPRVLVERNTIERQS